MHRRDSYPSPLPRLDCQAAFHAGRPEYCGPDCGPIRSPRRPRHTERGVLAGNETGGAASPARPAPVQAQTCRPPVGDEGRFAADPDHGAGRTLFSGVQGLRLLHASPCPPCETSRRRFRRVLYLRLGAPLTTACLPHHAHGGPSHPPSRQLCPPAGDMRHHLARGRCGRTRHPTARPVRYGPLLLINEGKGPNRRRHPKNFFATPSQRRRRLPNRCHLNRDPGGRAVRGSLLVG